MISLLKEPVLSALEKVNSSVQIPPSLAVIDSFATSDEFGLQVSPSERLHRLAVLEVRKLAISLMFPLLDKYKMPINFA